VGAWWGCELPDWRNPADYAYTEDFALHDWAWEFLRRNPEYRADWAALAEKRPSLPEEDFYAESRRIGDKYGLAVAVDPNLNRHEAEDLLWMIGVGVRLLYGVEKSQEGRPWPGFPNMAFLLFNLLEDIDSQVEDARRVLTIYQRALLSDLNLPPPKVSSVKPQTDKFLFYLRLLDARLEGLSQRDIGLGLYPDSFEPRDRVRHAIEAAEELACSGYRDLLYRPNT
jgi:hypothetical protein